MIYSYFFRALLRFLGWHAIPEYILKEFEKNPRLVCAFSHTSLWDFVILSIYLLAYPEELGVFRFLVRKDFFDRWYGIPGKMIRRIGAIPAGFKEQVSVVNETATELNKHDRFIFLISPKGSILLKPWRSGFYHIAEASNAKLCVIGLDYSILTPSMGIIYDRMDFDSMDDMIVHLKIEMGTITPVFPEREYYTDKTKLYHPPIAYKNIMGLTLFLILCVGINHFF